MKLKMVLFATLLCGLGVCNAQKLSYTFASGYATGRVYCRPGGNKLGLEHVKYWKQKGKVEYANGIRARLEVCSNNGEFKSPSKGGTLNDAICGYLSKENFPSVHKFVCSEKSDNSDNSKQ